MRFKILRIIIIALFILIIVNLFYAQVIRGRYFYDLSTNNRIRAVPLEGWRGRIQDRNHIILADNRLSYNLMLTPQDTHDLDQVFHFLSDVLSVSEKRIAQIYGRRASAPFVPIVIAEDISRQQAIAVEENRYRFPSLLVEQNFKRFYPLNNNSAHVLGYVGKINRSKLEKLKEYGYSAASMIGYLGVEEYYDRYLKGATGGLQVEVNSRGQQVRLLGFKEPAKGQDIRLTIDARIQQMALEILQENNGAIVVMDMKNGEILGMTSSPSYNPNIFLDHSSGTDIPELLNNVSSPMLNRVIRGTFSPGSVFKVIMAVAALDQHKVNLKQTFLCQGVYEVGGTKFGCTHSHGAQNLMDALTHSCNIYFYHVGSFLGETMIHQYAEMFGLGKLTNIDLPYEGTGFVPNRLKKTQSGGSWYTGDTLNFSIGQGDLLVTPLQLVRMMATVAQDGLEVQPHVVKSIDDKDVDLYSSVRLLGVDRNIFQSVQKGLRYAVTDFSGTAHSLNMDGLYVAGKTGTVQTSTAKANHAWFVGYTKGTQTEIAFCVFLEHGGSSANACLLARQLLLRMQEQKIL